MAAASDLIWSWTTRDTNLKQYTTSSSGAACFTFTHAAIESLSASLMASSSRDANDVFTRHRHRLQSPSCAPVAARVLSRQPHSSDSNRAAFILGAALRNRQHRPPMTPVDGDGGDCGRHCGNSSTLLKIFLVKQNDVVVRTMQRRAVRAPTASLSARTPPWRPPAPPLPRFAALFANCKLARKRRSGDP